MGYGLTYLYYGSTHNNAYLSAIMGLYNNKIVSSKLNTSIDLQFVEDSLSGTFSKEKGRDLSNLIIHNDQRYSYTSTIYKDALTSLL